MATTAHMLCCKSGSRLSFNDKGNGKMAKAEFICVYCICSSGVPAMWNVSTRKEDESSCK